MTTPSPVIQFWKAAGPEMWFAKNTDFDTAFRTGFLESHMAAARRELDGWSDTAEGSLALLLLLDQFPRNAFRDTAHMFATDSLALYFARKALAAGHHDHIDHDLKVFLILPFEHSENLADQELAVRLCRPLGGGTLTFAEIHLDIIRRFGRFPHRNAVLGRDTTPEEAAFLDQGGFKG